MAISASDLFYLFNQACAQTGNTGYSVQQLSKNSANVQACWTQFEKLLTPYVTGSNAPSAPTAAAKSGTTAKEDSISEAVKRFDWDGQKVMYRLLYNLGHRINS